MRKFIHSLWLFTLLAAPFAPPSLFAQDDHDSPLHEEMEGINHALRLVSRQYTDTTQKTSTLTFVAEMQKHAETARTLTPPKAAKMSGDQQTQYLNTFHSDLDKLLVEIAALKQAITANQIDVAKAEIDKIGQLKQSSHKELGVGGENTTEPRREPRLQVRLRRQLHRDRKVWRTTARALVVTLMLLAPGVEAAENQLPSLATQVHVIFQAKCVECHDADLAHPKGKFGYVLDLPRVAANPKMIEPGNPSKSELYQMVWHNEMPDPKGDSPPLTLEEKAIVKAWIETLTPTALGAGTVEVPTAVTNTAPQLTLSRRIIRDAGQFHPPSTHFPIALLIVALPAELMWTLTRKDSWKATVRFCVVLGAASAVVTATLGWCDAAVSTYRGSTAEILMWHRWFGTATAVWAIVVAAVSEFASRRGNPDRRSLVFRLTLVSGIILVSVAGYLGASLIYGPHHFTW